MFESMRATQSDLSQSKHHPSRAVILWLSVGFTCISSRMRDFKQKDSKMVEWNMKDSFCIVSNIWENALYFDCIWWGTIIPMNIEYFRYLHIPCQWLWALIIHYMCDLTLNNMQIIFTLPEQKELSNGMLLPHSIGFEQVHVGWLFSSW